MPDESNGKGSYLGAHSPCGAPCHHILTYVCVCVLVPLCALVPEASAYVINGLESNIACGGGLRIVRWLRTNELVS